jgi:hypothetical protein
LVLAYQTICHNLKDYSMYSWYWQYLLMYILYAKSTTTEPIYSRWLTKEKVFYLILCRHVYRQISIEICICSWQYFHTYCKTYEITKWLEQMWSTLNSASRPKFCMQRISIFLSVNVYFSIYHSF